MYSDVPLGTVYGAADGESDAPSLGKVIGGGAVALAVGGGAGALVGIALTLGYVAASALLFPEGNRTPMGRRLAEVGGYVTFGAPILLGIGYGGMVTYAGYQKYLAARGAA